MAGALLAMNTLDRRFESLLDLRLMHLLRRGRHWLVVIDRPIQKFSQHVIQAVTATKPSVDYLNSVII